MAFSQIILDAQTVIALQPEELAGPLLEYLRNLEMKEPNNGELNRWSFIDGSCVDGYPNDLHYGIRQALNEAWAWLEREGLLVLRPDDNGRHGWYRLSQRAREFTSAADLRAFRSQKRLPREQLHPRIAQKVWSSFVRGEYDTAVFQAFKEVEVAVREVAGLPNEMVGSKLMKTAFHPENGPLADADVDGAGSRD